jgi:sporadic carbohydrate cluster protein (TIGR04323 family)
VSGYRGYIASRPILGERAPQHVQNLVVRNYAQRRGLTFLLSATEWVMDECHMVLGQVLDEIDTIDGIIAYSLFMLPADPERRAPMWRRILGAGRSFHGALEGIAVSDWAGVDRVEDLWLARTVLARCPSGMPMPGAR